MNKNVKIIAVSIIILAMGGFFYCLFRSQKVQRPTIMLSQAKEYDKENFEKQKEIIAQYYLSGAYEADVQKIIEEAKKYFVQVPVEPDSIIIFDVDDTAVYQYHRRPDSQFIWEKHPMLSQARDPKLGTPIKPVLDLYNFLKNHGFKIIFLTSRNDGFYEGTAQELQNAGYADFEKLILMPDELAFNPEIKTADWKLSERKRLSEIYNIVGNIGDRGADFVGGYSGHEVKLPNYIY